ncbi:GDYXXLXY domain-containing protein [Candidatus Parabeggiatoa sp. HSG14]|uniref:GDYXXLXY domain-containing protein n=1 Tax=Candidatus Parabeggiatoa sp. HSG14 TaxID=3055593 RepID=UPI0025A7FBED|nr:GDYXXLXY domain-containing protein [Thiotrichales bacterium HSG14]
MQRLFVLVMAVVILAAVNFEIYKKELLIAEGKVVLLELAPVDPRSLMQGDYMILRYAIARLPELREVNNDGYLVIELDKNQVAHFNRIHDDQVQLQPTEVLLRFRKRGRNIRLGAESFFFQEGHAEYYNNARYGELRVTSSGDSVLVGLRDKNLNPLKAPVDNVPSEESEIEDVDNVPSEAPEEQPQVNNPPAVEELEKQPPANVSSDDQEISNK